MWYRQGSVAVANGSAIVTGAGTDFVANAQVGEAFVGPNGRPIEIASIQSATQLTLAQAYTGDSNGGQPYSIQPTSSFARDLALAAGLLLNSFAMVRDGVGQGLFPDGTVAAPGIRFAADQDTGLRRTGSNGLSLVSAGQDRLLVDPNSVTVSGTSFVVNGASSASTPIARFIGNNGNGQIAALPGLSLYWNMGNGPQETSFVYGAAASSFLTFGHHDGTSYKERFRIDSAGNLLMGVSAAGTHTIHKAVAANAGNSVLDVSSPAGIIATFFAVDQGAAASSPAQTALVVRRDGTTLRSINATGTVNTAGADYAEYMKKANGCGKIAKGDVAGVDRNGELTRTWADARRYVVKSTDPNLVGGDTWAAHLGQRPEAPVYAAPAYDGPTEPAEADGRSARDAYTGAQDDYAKAVVAAEAAHAAAMKDHAAALTAWESELEEARQTVDRIAFSGQVPVNVDADTIAACEAALGDGVAVYLVAVARGAGIGVTAVRETDMTLPLYMRRLGAVWAIRDGRPWIDVQHG
ncbi:MAG: hypothetical protein V3V60_16005 [Sphingomonas aquatilis]|uniref:hypothetical protein n=1 Tax=Sphingomonas aquatilis TaxID=93063 RepID=UPI002F342C83